MDRVNTPLALVVALACLLQLGCSKELARPAALRILQSTPGVKEVASARRPPWKQLVMTSMFLADDGTPMETFRRDVEFFDALVKHGAAKANRQVRLAQYDLLVPDTERSENGWQHHVNSFHYTCEIGDVLGVSQEGPNALVDANFKCTAIMTEGYRRLVEILSPLIREAECTGDTAPQFCAFQLKVPDPYEVRVRFQFRRFDDGWRYEKTLPDSL